MKTVANKTRAGENGRKIYCPKCNHEITVGHFSWSAMMCQGCGSEIQKCEFLTEETPAEILGKKGGQAKSPSKTAAAKKNATKPRSRWVTAIQFTLDGYKTEMFTIVKGRGPEDMEKHLNWCVDKVAKKYPHMKNIEYVGSISEKI